MNVLVAGGPGSGKTTWCSEYISYLRECGCSVGGILSPEVRLDTRRIGYDVVDLLTCEEMPFARLAGDGCLDGERVGAYVISWEGIAFGIDAIERAVGKACEFVVIDEVGYLELFGRGLMPAVSLAWKSSLNNLVVVRSELVRAFLRYVEQEVPEPGAETVSLLRL